MHLGKRIYGFSMAEDQGHILDQIAGIAEDRGVDAMIIAGDVYDRPVPTEEAVTMFGDFLERVLDSGCSVYIVAGNHDSGPRLGFCGPILDRSGIHIAGEFTGRAERVVVEDGHGDLNVWLLPYFKVSEVRSRLGLELEGYTRAMEAVLAASGVDPSERNVLVAHQFFQGSSVPVTSDSEDQRPEVGGIECIPAGTLGPFDYVALGHLHIPQAVSRETVRYSGSPLKYSASEAHSPKSVVVADIRGKGDVSVEAVPLTPLRDLRIVTGRFRDIIEEGLSDPSRKDDYIVAQVTGALPPDLSDLRKTFPNLLNVARVGAESSGTWHGEPEAVRRETPEELFARFYRDTTGQELTPYQMEVVRGCVYGGESE